MGRGFTSIPQREPTPELPLPPQPEPGNGSVLGVARMVGPLPTQEIETEHFEPIEFGAPAEAALLENTLGLSFNEHKIIFPHDGIYIVCLSFYPVYRNAQSEWRNVQMVNGSVSENAFFDFSALSITTGNEKLTGEQITALVPIFGGSPFLEYDFEMNKAAPENVVLISVEELLVIGVT